MSAHTRLTKRGEPVQGTSIELQRSDGVEQWWTPVKVVGKGWSPDNRLVMIIVEWPEGDRSRLDRFPDLIWRPIPEHAKDSHPPQKDEG